MQGAEPAQPRLEIRLLGPVEVTISERPLAFGRRKQRALVAVLALNANRVVSTDRLLDALWGERPPPTAAVALYGLISVLRKRLEPDGSEFCDRGIEADIQRALTLQTTDPYLANQLWARIDRAIVDRAPVVPLFTLKELDIVSRRVGNYQYNPQWGVLIDQLWVR